ncbi:MAG: UbiA family prenyltransferase [Planctomycetota bacterium]
MSAIRAWLELGRVSNMPTVWSNVLHGMAVAFFVAVVLPVREQYPDAPPIAGRDLMTLLNSGFMLMIAMSLMYLGGMVLNDACDAKVDAKERPTRPIPSGRVPRASAFMGGVGLLAAGWACTLVYRPLGEAVPIFEPPVARWSAFLVLVIVAYNLLHRWLFLGVVLMPVCRGLVIWIAALAVSAGIEFDYGEPRVLGSVVAVTCYTLIVTLIAWGEALPNMKKIAPWVGVLIAGLAFLDAGFMLLMGMWPMAVFCAGCGGLSLVGQRWIAGS